MGTWQVPLIGDSTLRPKWGKRQKVIGTVLDLNLIWPLLCYFFPSPSSLFRARTSHPHIENSLPKVGREGNGGSPKREGAQSFAMLALCMYVCMDGWMDGWMDRAWMVKEHGNATFVM
jgi:hypothetical protein